MRTPGRNCEGCRYWSEMIAKSGPREVEAMCLAEGGPFKGKYTEGSKTCDAYAKNSCGAVDEPPDYGEAACAAYSEQAAMKHPNGAPKFAKDGTLLDDKGNRSIFDDVDE